MSTRQSDAPPIDRPSDRPKRRDRRHERHDRTRADILEAAWTIAQNDGVAAVSLRALARAIGVQPQSLYTYFGSKNDLLDEMFAQSVTEFLAVVRTVSGEPPLDRVRRGTAVFVDLCVHRPERFLLVFQRTIPGFAPGAASMALAFEFLQELTEALGEAGVHDPEIIDLFTAAVTGLISQQISNEPGGHRWTALLDRMIDALLSA